MSDNRLRRILFVDDDPNILTALKRQLRRKFEIETCDDSTRALDVIDSQGPFAVVISDLRMKGLDGLEFLKLATSRNPDSICIILTGFADLDVAVQAVNNGQIFRFLTKPCPPEILQQALNEALSNFDQNLRLAGFPYAIQFEQGQPTTTCRGRGCLAVTGYTAHELARDEELWTSIVLPEYRLSVWEELQKRFLGEQTGPYEFKIRRQDGSIRWIRNTVIAHRDEQGLLSRCEGLIEDITDRREMEEALDKSRTRYERMVANAPGLVFQWILKSDGSLSFDFVSDNCRSMFGLEPEQLREDPQILLGRLDAADRAELYRLLAESAGGLIPLEWTGGGTWGDQKRCFRAVARPERLPSGDTQWDGLMLDMTDYRRIEQQARQLARFPSEDPSPVLRVDAAGKILYANKASEVLLNLWQCAVGQTVPPDMLELICGVRVSGIHECLEVRAGDRVFSIVFAPINESDYVNLYAHEITEVKLAQLDLMRANEVLLEHDRLKSEFVSTVSHELRTPLCIFKNIISNALAGVMGKLSPKLQDNLRMADKSVDRLSRIIGDFLDISKIESGTLQFHCTEVILQTLIEEVVQSLQALAAAKSIRIELDLPQSDLSVTADRDRLIQVLTNLVGNAVKFIPVGGWIRVELADQPSEVEIAVRDNGPGLTQEEMKKVFDRFVQIHKIAGAGEHGTGLGLTIAKNLVEMHHGRIWVESVPGCGCCFRFTLPKQSPLAQPALAADHAANP